MAYLKIDYSQLDDNARRAGDTARRLREYADRINRGITNPVGNTTGGQNGNTYSVTNLAKQKADDLRKKAEEYETLKRKLENLHNDAEDTDKRVAQKLKADQGGYMQNLTWFEKLCVNLHDYINGFVGESEFGRFINNMNEIARLGTQYKHNALKIASDFFVHGNGRYLLNIAIGVAAAVAAVVAVIMTGGVLAVIAAVVAIGVAAVTLIDNITAMINNNDHPGYAKHMGSTDSLGSFAEKHFFDSKTQNAFRVVDFIGKAAAILTSLKGMFSATNPTTGAKTIDVSWETFKKNALDKFGLTNAKSPVSNDEYWHLRDGLADGSVVRKTIAGNDYYYEASKLYQNVTKYKSLSNAENITKNVKQGLKDFQTLTTTRRDGFKAKEVGQTVQQHIPFISDAYSIWKDGEKSKEILESMAVSS